MSRAETLTFICPPGAGLPLLNLSRCNGDPDCLPSDDFQANWRQAYCNALSYVSRSPRRTVEIWTHDKKRRLARITAGWIRPHRLAECNLGPPGPSPSPGDQAGPEPFTVDIPGLTDIIKHPSLESPRLRYERFQRMQTANSAVPKALQWIPPLLTKLDDAQDLLFTTLAILHPIFKRLPRAFLGPLGVILTINDILNLFT